MHTQCAAAARHRARAHARWGGGRVVQNKWKYNSGSEHKAARQGYRRRSQHAKNSSSSSPHAREGGAMAGAGAKPT